MILDSDILIYFLKGEKTVVANVLKIPPHHLYITRINAIELLYGANHSTRIEENLAKIIPFLEQFEVLELDQKAGEVFAKTKAALNKKGTMIADMDLMIAAIAIANQEPLATNNTKHFERIKELEIVNLCEAP